MAAALDDEFDDLLGSSDDDDIPRDIPPFVRAVAPPPGPLLALPDDVLSNIFASSLLSVRDASRVAICCRPLPRTHVAHILTQFHGWAARSPRSAPPIAAALSLTQLQIFSKEEADLGDSVARRRDLVAALRRLATLAGTTEVIEEQADLLVRWLGDVPAAAMDVLQIINVKSIFTNAYDGLLATLHRESSAARSAALTLFAAIWRWRSSDVDMLYMGFIAEPERAAHAALEMAELHRIGALELPELALHLEIVFDYIYSEDQFRDVAIHLLVGLKKNCSIDMSEVIDQNLLLVGSHWERERALEAFEVLAPAKILGYIRNCGVASTLEVSEHELFISAMEKLSDLESDVLLQHADVVVARIHDPDEFTRMSALRALSRLNPMPREACVPGVVEVLAEFHRHSYLPPSRFDILDKFEPRDLAGHSGALRVIARIEGDEYEHARHLARELLLRNGQRLSEAHDSFLAVCGRYYVRRVHGDPIINLAAGVAGPARYTSATGALSLVADPEAGGQIIMKGVMDEYAVNGELFAPRLAPKTEGGAVSSNGEFTFKLTSPLKAGLTKAQGTLTLSDSGVADANGHVILVGTYKFYAQRPDTGFRSGETREAIWTESIRLFKAPTVTRARLVPADWPLSL